MYASSTELRSYLKPSHHSRCSVATNNLLESESILETLTDLLFALLDELFLSFPFIRESLFIKYYTDISKFLAIHNTDFDTAMIKNFDDSLKIQLKSYTWELKLKPCLLSQWRNLLLSQLTISLYLIEGQITEMIKENMKNLDNLLKLARFNLSIVQFKINPFPRISHFNSFFTKISHNLKQKTLFMLKQETFKTARVQRAQVENLAKKIQSRTEWINFSEIITETLNYDEGVNSLINCCKRCMKRVLISKAVNFIYNGSPGWEITRVYTEVIDGRFNDISILSAKITNNSLCIEVEVWFNKFLGKQVWFSLKIEGTSCRRKNFESTISEIRDFLVVVDCSGSYEINEDF